MGNSRAIAALIRVVAAASLAAFWESMVEKPFLAALKIICDRLTDSTATWAVTGSLGMALQGMKLEVHDIDLQTNTTGAYEIEKRLSEYIIQPVRYVTSERIQSHLGVLKIEGIKVEIMGALQKLLDGQKWERPIEVAKYRHFVETDGMRVPVLSLAYEQQAYRQLGRVDRAAAIERWLKGRLAIVPFCSQDQRVVKELILEGLKEHWGALDESKNPDLDDIASSYASGVFLVAWRNGEIVGTGAFRPLPDGTVEVVRMSVQAGLRRRGIGRIILAELCQRAYRKGYKKAVLETTASWQEVIEFYKAFGFEVMHYADGNLHFALDLQEFVTKDDIS